MNKFEALVRDHKIGEHDEQKRNNEDNNSFQGINISKRSRGKVDMSYALIKTKKSVPLE